MAPFLKSWNQASTGKTVGRRTLIIEPVVTQIKFIGGAARFWAGPAAGSSAIIMHAMIIEKETGKTIATPEFYIKSGAWSGGWTIGVTDNLMLTRIAEKFKDYLVANYASAVGGTTDARQK